MIGFIILSIWITLLIFLYVPNYVRNRRRIIKVMKQFDGPPMNPVLGHALELLCHHTVLVKKAICWSKIYKSPLGFWLLHVPVVVIGKPEDIQIVTSKNLEKDPVYEYLSEFLGDGLITCNWTKWKRRRRIVSPVFSNHNLLNNFLSVFNKYTQTLIQNLEVECEKGHEKDAWPHFFNVAFNSICENTMGSSIHEENLSNYSRLFNRAATLVGHRVYQPWFYPSLVFKIYKYFKGDSKTIEQVQAIPKKIIKKRNSVPESAECIEDKTPKDLITLLREARDNNSYFSDVETADEILTILFAGTDTISVTSACTLLMLGIKPELQDKVYAEMNEIFGDSNRMPTPDDLDKMIYLDQCIKETLRYSSMVPLIIRTSDEDIPITDGYVIPAGVKIAICSYLLHHDESIYENPHTWNPDNFTREKIESRHPCTFMPFGTGLRICLGARYAMVFMKVIISSVIRNFIVTTRIKNEEDIEWGLHFMLSPIECPMKFQYRHRTSIF